MYANKYMDTTTTVLLVCQALTIFLLIISETLPMSASPYSGILQALLSKVEKEMIDENK
jgi:hypothetical protein